MARGTGDVQETFLVPGIAAVVCACGAALIRFSVVHKEDELALYDEAVAQRLAVAGNPPGVAATA